MDNFLEPLAVGAVGDLARNAAAARGVGHQHGKAAGERQISGERRPLVAALLLDDLHQQHLAALDHFLNFVLPARAGGAEGNFLHRVAADMFDVIGFVVMLVVMVVVVLVVVVRRGKPGFLAHADVLFVAFVLAARLGFVILLGRFELGFFGGADFDHAKARGVDSDRFAHALAARRRQIRVGLGMLRQILRRQILRRRILRRRILRRLGGAFLWRFEALEMLRFDNALFRQGVFAPPRLDAPQLFARSLERLHFEPVNVVVLGRSLGLVVAALRRSSNHAVVGRGAFFGAVVIMAPPRAPAPPLRLGTMFIFLGLPMSAAFLLEQCDAVGDRDLVIIGMDFGKGQKTMAIAAVIDESGLKRRLHAGHLGEVNITSQRHFVGGLEIEFLDFVTAKHHHPSFLRVGGVYKHFVGHGRLFAASRVAGPAASARTRPGVRRPLFGGAISRKRICLEEKKLCGFAHADRRGGRWTDVPVDQGGNGASRRDNRAEEQNDGPWRNCLRARSWPGSQRSVSPGNRPPWT